MQVSKQTLFLFIFIGFLFINCNRSSENTKLAVADSVNADALFQKYHLNKIKLPPGFTISVYAEVPNARSMTMSPSGVLYVGTRSSDKVYAVTDVNKDGRADKVFTVASGLHSPNGVAFKDGNLYIDTISAILTINNIEASLASPAKPVTIYDGYPKDEHHGWKFIAFGPDGKLYVPVGAPCNICESENPVYAGITRMNADGTGMEIFASGIRNTVGFTWHPDTHAMWFTDNGRDAMGDNIPGDELNVASKPGMHFGYPYCHQGNIPDPQFGKNKSCSDYTAPVQVLGPHVAALGLRFYTGKSFPAAYHNQLFIAEHGSWNRSEPIGYRISLVKMDAGGKVQSYSTFAEGWLQKDGNVLGRPVDVLVNTDGSLLVSDDYAGVIYKIAHK